VLRTLQITTVGQDTDIVLTGIRNFPTHKLALICQFEDKEKVEDFASHIKMVLKIPLDIYVLSKTDNIIDSVLESVAEILKKDEENFDDFIVNVAGGEKTLTCAAVSAAFINGLKAFHVVDDKPLMLPILKLSFTEIVSNAKIQILRSLYEIGGKVKSLNRLEKVSGYGKPLLSHHITGSENSKGLVNLGLVETERGKRGRMQVKLTTLGRMLILRTLGSTK
jgi:hypothetical protein